MQNAAAQGVDNVRQMRDQIAERSGRRDHRIAVPVELLDFERIGGGFQSRPGSAEHADESAVDRVGRAVAVRMDADADIRTLRPVLVALRIHRVGFSPEIAHLTQRYRAAPFAFRRRHRNIPPGGMSERELAALRVDDLMALDGGASQVGP